MARNQTRTQRASAARPMISRINWALLGLVIERPGYGYQLMKRFEAQFGELLPLSSDSHIYAALDVLERRALVEERPEKPAARSGVGRQPRPIYHATTEGRRRYQQWLLAQAGELHRPWLLFVRQLATLASEPEAALQILERYGETCLNQAVEASQKSPPARPDSAAALAGLLTSEEQRLAGAVKLAWVEFAQRQFEILAKERR